MAGSIHSTDFLVSQILLQFQKAIEGFRFSPTEQELINYLKSEGHRGGFCIIPTLENITNFNPDDLPGKFLEKSIIPFNEREWWFICPQMQKQPNYRKTPCGSSWGITGQPRDIIIEGKKIGFKRILGFPYDKRPKGSKSDWIIHEYHLSKDSPNSRNNVLCHLMKKQESPTRSEDGKFTLAEAERWYDQRNEKHVVEEGISSTLCTFSLPHLLQLLQREVESLSIHQSTNIGSSYGPYANFQNGEEPDKTIESESSLGTTEKNVWADSLLESDTEVQQGEGPRLEKVWQEAKNVEVQQGEGPRFEKVRQEAKNVEPCIYSDEAAADRAKNGQIFTTDDRRSKVKPPNRVLPPEETKGIPSSPLRSSGFSDFREFGGYFDQPADQEKGPDREEHNLVDGSPKKRRLNVSEENQIQ